MATSGRGLPLIKIKHFIQGCLLVLDRGSGKPPFRKCHTTNTLDMCGKIQIPMTDLKSDLEEGDSECEVIVHYQFISHVLHIGTRFM